MQMVNGGIASAIGLLFWLMFFQCAAGCTYNIFFQSENFGDLIFVSLTEVARISTLHWVFLVSKLKIFTVKDSIPNKFPLKLPSQHPD